MMMNDFCWLPNGVTTRQFDVWRLLASGMDNDQIGERMRLSRTTVTYEVGQLYDKLSIVENGSKRVKLANLFPQMPLTRGV